MNPALYMLFNNNNQIVPTHVDTPKPGDTIYDVSPKRYEFILKNDKSIVCKPRDISVVNGTIFTHEECFDGCDIWEIKVTYPIITEEIGKRIHYQYSGAPWHPTAKVTEVFE